MTGKWVYNVLSLCHCRVAEFESINKMTIINLASIFGPVLMTLDKVGYDATLWTYLDDFR